MSKGRVTLVGAGPGCADLLTLKAVKALAQATVALVDDLVSQDVLDLVNASARIIHVGKRGGCATSTPQENIHQLMLKEARQGEQVVRIKGGDPYIFGRGGEEVEGLFQLNIPVEVINGISAGLAGATDLLIPLTYRNVAQGVMYVTGHARRDGQHPHWESIGRYAVEAQMTLVIYMGIKTIASIREGLMQSMPGDMPAAIVENATLLCSQYKFCQLKDIALTIERAKLKSPSIIVIGPVVARSPLYAIATLPPSVGCTETNKTEEN